MKFFKQGILGRTKSSSMGFFNHQIFQTWISSGIEFFKDRIFQTWNSPSMEFFRHRIFQARNSSTHSYSLKFWFFVSICCAAIFYNIVHVIVCIYCYNSSVLQQIDDCTSFLWCTVLKIFTVFLVSDLLSLMCCSIFTVNVFFC